MAFVNFATREITAKIVYYGPGLGGKTTSLQYIHGNLSPENRGKMISLATEEDRTIYFDFLPLNLGKIQDFAVRVQLYTVPGQVRYNATRKLVLRGADGLVFVADSQKHKKLANLESFSNMEENLRELAKDLRDLPHVLQFNKVDLPGIMSSEELNQVLNKYNVPFYESVATTGIGVLDSLKAITKLVFNDLSKKALLQKKSKTTGVSTTSAGTEYTLGAGIAAAQPVAAAAAVKTAPAPPPAPPPPPPKPEPVAPSPSYYGDSFQEPEEILGEDMVGKVEDTYSSSHEGYSPIELEDEGISPGEATSLPDVEPIAEVEPLAEFDEMDSESEPEQMLDDATVVEPGFDITEDEAEFSVEEPVIAVPIVPAVPKEPLWTPPPVEPAPAPAKPITAEKAPVPPQPAAAQPEMPPPLSYRALFREHPAFAALMLKVEQQITSGDLAGALASSRTAYDAVLHQVFPETLALDGSEVSRALVAGMNLRRFARGKALLWAEPTVQNLLMVHHFLCELYLSVKEL